MEILIITLEILIVCMALCCAIVPAGGIHLFKSKFGNGPLEPRPERHQTLSTSPQEISTSTTTITTTSTSSSTSDSYSYNYSQRPAPPWPAVVRPNSPLAVDKSVMDIETELNDIRG